MAVARVSTFVMRSRGCLLHSSVVVSSSLPSNNLPVPAPPPPPQELDFWKAADILFSEEEPRRRKKFGWDFHLWQAFVACLPSVAIYLIAQYARYEIRRMEKERGIAPKDMKAQKAALEAARPSAVRAPASHDNEPVKLKDLRTIKERLEALESKIQDMEALKASTAVEGAKRVDHIQEESPGQKGDAKESEAIKSNIPVAGQVDVKALGTEMKQSDRVSGVEVKASQDSVNKTT